MESIIKSTHSLKLVLTSGNDYEVWADCSLVTTCTHLDAAERVYSELYDLRYFCVF